MTGQAMHSCCGGIHEAATTAWSAHCGHCDDMDLSAAPPPSEAPRPGGTSLVAFHPLRVPVSAERAGLLHSPTPTRVFYIPGGRPPPEAHDILRI